jgi:hypothetical protein
MEAAREEKKVEKSFITASTKYLFSDGAGVCVSEMDGRKRSFVNRLSM